MQRGWGRFSGVTARDGFSGRLSHSNGFPSPRHDDRRRDWWRCPTTASLSPLHIQHTPVNLVALIFYSETFNLQINPSEKISWLVGSVSNSILHFIVSGISICSSSVTHKTHVCSITKIRLVNAPYEDTGWFFPKKIRKTTASRSMLWKTACISSQQPAPNNTTCCSFPSITRPKRNHVHSAHLRQSLLLTSPYTQTRTQRSITSVTLMCGWPYFVIQCG